jgi:hypothetical protein
MSYFRRIWKNAIDVGLQPGTDLSDWSLRVHHDLKWLVEGHPLFPSMSVFGIRNFTFRPDGRGNHRFVLVDTQGTEHPFSTVSALTGFETPLREPPKEDDLMGGLTS